MAAKVVDASALAALVFGEPDGEAIAARLRGSALFAPALLRFELANTCVKKMRRYPELRDSLTSVFGLVARMGIETVDVDHLEVVNLADESGLTAYDASYLWLALRLKAELVTLDTQLIAVRSS